MYLADGQNEENTNHVLISQRISHNTMSKARLANDFRVG